MNFVITLLFLLLCNCSTTPSPPTPTPTPLPTASPSPSPVPTPTPNPTPTPVPSPIPTPSPQPTPSPVPTPTPQPTPTPFPTPTGIPIPPPYTRLAFDDEFNGTSLDLTKWNYEVNGDGGGNNELQYYTNLPTNSYVQNGFLTIQANEQSYMGKAYTSARLNTLSKFSFAYGRVDVSAQLPIGQGLWPAIWMLPEPPVIPNPIPTSTVGDAGVYGAWPLSGEIDIMELIGSLPSQVIGTLVYGTVGNPQFTNNTYNLPSGNFNQAFHLFTLEWNVNTISWYVDGNIYSTKTPTNLGTYLWTANAPFFLLLNVAVGGNLPGPPTVSTLFPQQMVIDYVRVFQ